MSHDPPKKYDTHGRTELQGALSDSGTSAIRKYRAINVGRDGWWDLIKYEIYTLLLAPLPGAVGYALRKLYLPRLLGSCGAGVVVGRSVTLRHPHKIHLGRGVAVDDYAVLDAKGGDNTGIFVGDEVLIGRNTVISCKNGDIRIGRGSNIAQACFIQSAREVVVGEKVLFGAYCYLIGGGDHVATRSDVPVMDQGQTIRGIKIDDFVWLGAAVKVVDGVRVGRDAILGAGAVVTEDVSEYAIVAGVPARLIRDRRDSEQGQP